MMSVNLNDIAILNVHGVDYFTFQYTPVDASLNLYSQVFSMLLNVELLMELIKGNL